MKPAAERILTTPSELGDIVSPYVTGNEWVALPDIFPSDASLGSINIVRMASKGLVEWVGEFEEDQDRRNEPKAPFLRPFVNAIGASGKPAETESVGDIEWTWLGHWIPVGKCRLRTKEGHECVAKIAFCAPVGERGFMVALELSELEARNGASHVQFHLGLEGNWGATVSTVFGSRLMHVTNHAYYSPWTNSLILEARGTSSVGALAFSADSQFDWAIWASKDGVDMKESPVLAVPNGSADIRFRLSSSMTLAANEHRTVAFWIAANADPDGAGTTNVHLRRVGAEAALGNTLSWLEARAHSSRVSPVEIGEADEEILARADRNLHFCRFFAHGKAIDTEELVMLTSRSYRYYVSAVFWPRDTFLWAFPAMLASDHVFAREVLTEGFRRHVRNMGTHAHYIDGVLLYPGFELDQLASYVIALGTYIEATGDASLADKAVIADGLDQFDLVLAAQRHPDVALYKTFLDPSDDPVVYPYLTYDNVLAWRALRILSEIARNQGDDYRAERSAAMAQATESSILEHCIAPGPFGQMFAWSTDLAGNYELYDDPPGSLVLLPYHGFVDADNECYANTLKFIRSDHNPYACTLGNYKGAGCAHSKHPWPMHACNMILAGVADADALHLIENAPLDGGLACETVYASTGKAATGSAFATFAGYLSLAAFTCFRQNVGQ
ncbi:MAG TPA: glycoside hydrolase family 125 protein [Bacillota bacterium]|nr:glycoside hydrolase family 125 protein [Bacillota bacterium]